MGATGSRSRPEALGPMIPGRQQQLGIRPVLPAVWLAAILALTPLAIAPGLFLYYDVTPKIVILCVAAVGLVFLVVPSIQSLWLQRNGRCILLVILSLGASLLLSTLFSSSPTMSVSGSNWRRFGFPTQVSLLLFLLVAIHTMWRAPHLRQFLLRVVAIVTLTTGLYAVCQYFEIDPLIQHQLYSVGQFGQPILRPPATVGSAPGFANYSIMAVFLAVVVWRHDISVAWRRAAALAVVAGVAGILLSGTRSALLGLIVGGSVLTGARVRRVSLRTVRHAALATVVLAAFVVSPAGRYFRNRAVQAWGDWHGGTRIWLWRDCLSMIAQRPLLGYGLDTFAANYPRFQSAGLARAYPDSYNESPHNLLFDALTSQGIVGFLPLVALLAMVLPYPWRAHETQSEIAPVSAGLLAALFAHQFFSLDVTTAVYFYFGISLVLAARMSRYKPLDEKRVRITARVCQAVTAVLLAAFSVKLAAADWSLARAQRAMAQNRLSQSVEAYNMARAWAPPGFDSSLWFSRALLDSARQNNQLAAMLPAVTEAAQYAYDNAEDRHDACMHLAMLHAAAGETDQALRLVRQANALAPAWFIPYWAEASLLLSRREYARAEELAKRAVDLAGKHREEMTRLLDSIQAARAQAR